MVHYDPRKVEEMFRQRLAGPDVPCVGSVIEGHITLKIPAVEQHYWSPQLNISLEESEGGTEISGIYGPHPGVWSAFFYGYAAIGLLAMFLSVWACALWMLKKDASIAWGLPVLGGLALVLYMVAQGGQKVGAEQTFTLHHFFEDTIGGKTHIN
jgi:hypothetical protein